LFTAIAAEMQAHFVVTFRQSRFLHNCRFQGEFPDIDYLRFLRVGGNQVKSKSIVSDSISIINLWKVYDGAGKGH